MINGCKTLINIGGLDKPPQILCRSFHNFFFKNLENLQKSETFFKDKEGLCMCIFTYGNEIPFLNFFFFSSGVKGQVTKPLFDSGVVLLASEKITQSWWELCVKSLFVCFFPRSSD